MNSIKRFKRLKQTSLILIIPLLLAIQIPLVSQSADDVRGGNYILMHTYIID